MPDYRTPGVYIEEISSGPRPVQASATTETGFVGVLTLPKEFAPGRSKAAGLFLPGPETAALTAWNRTLAFRALSAAPAAAPAPAAPTAGGDEAGRKAPRASVASNAGAGSNRISTILSDVLDGTWEVVAPDSTTSALTLTSGSNTIRIPLNRTLMSATADNKWDLSSDNGIPQFLQLVAAHALAQNIGPKVSTESDSKAVAIERVQEGLHRTAAAVQSLDGYDQWRSQFGAELFQQIAAGFDPTMTAARARVAWESLSGEARAAWDSWLRGHPGIRRLELSLRGFFENGGKTAFVSVAVTGPEGSIASQRNFLSNSFDGIKAVAMICAPGLNLSWQQAILEYAGPKGRGDIFAVLDTPRYLLTLAPSGTKLDGKRWTDSGPYEMLTLDTCSSPTQELRFSGYAGDQLLDTTIPRDDTGFGAAYGPWLVVENPLSTGAHDRYVIAPPSGHVAGVIAFTDLKGGGGVHKAPANEQVAGLIDLVTAISDREQEALNVKSINIIRQRPGAGIRIWGARTVASDALWRYINVRRMFLFVERSVRDAIQWAVFLPNSDRTRADLRNTIAGFLYSLYNQGMLDGRTFKEAFSVQCNRDNNPDVDVRNGIMTVDVQMRPLFPAEFIRVRFRQSPAQSEVAEA